MIVVKAMESVELSMRTYVLVFESNHRVDSSRHVTPCFYQLP